MELLPAGLRKRLPGFFPSGWKRQRADAGTRSSPRGVEPVQAQSGDGPCVKIAGALRQGIRRPESLRYRGNTLAVFNKLRVRHLPFRYVTGVATRYDIPFDIALCRIDPIDTVVYEVAVIVSPLFYLPWRAIAVVAIGPEQLLHLFWRSQKVQPAPFCTALILCNQAHECRFTGLNILADSAFCGVCAHSHSTKFAPRSNCQPLPPWSRRNRTCTPMLVPFPYGQV